MTLEEWVEVARQLTLGLLQKMGIETEVEAFVREGELYIEIKSDEEGILIGKQGRTLESLQTLISRMVNKQVKKPVGVILDIADYKKRRVDSLTKMASRLGDRVKKTGKEVAVGPFSAHDRRIIHITLKEDPSLKTESLGEGEWKKIKIIPTG
jgi:spoIIIJ-associated protein